MVALTIGLPSVAPRSHLLTHAPFDQAVRSDLLAVSVVVCQHTPLPPAQRRFQRSAGWVLADQMFPAERRERFVQARVGRGGL
jgi:hypothetical protein